MEFGVYQAKAHSTSLNSTVDGNAWLYPILGIAGESGEVLEKVKKLFRDSGGVVTEEFKSGLKKECGDLLWYIAETCTKLDMNLEDVAQTNLDKLASRAARGVQHGSGDNR